MNPEAILLFGPYIFLPLLLRLWFRSMKRTYRNIPYLITGLLLFIYPIVFVWVKEQYLTPATQTRCGTMDFAILLSCILLFLPVSMGLQALFNYTIKDKV